MIDMIAQAINGVPVFTPVEVSPDHIPIIVIGDFPNLVDPATWLPHVPGTYPVYLEVGGTGAIRHDALKALSSDPLKGAYLPIATRTREELSLLILALGQTHPVVLAGFGVGGLLALWAGADNRDAPIASIVSVNGAPNWEFLKERHPHYEWPNPEIKETLLNWDVSYRIPRIGSRSVLLIHGQDNRDIRPDWIEEFFLMALGVNPHASAKWAYHRIPGLSHCWSAGVQKSAPEQTALDLMERWIRNSLEKG